MASPWAILLLIMFLFATAVQSAARSAPSSAPPALPSTARSAQSAAASAARSALSATPSTAPSTTSSVEFSEKSVSEHEEADQRDKIAIDGNCRDTKCCGYLCEVQIRHEKIVDVGYRFKNGVHQCLCTVIRKDKPSPSPA